MERATELVTSFYKLTNITALDEHVILMSSFAFNL